MRLPKIINTPFPNVGYEREYVAFMNRFVKILEDKTLPHIIAAFRVALKEQEALVRGDAWPELIESAVANVKLDMNEPLRQGMRFIVDMADRVSGYSRGQWQRAAEAQTGVSMLRSEPWLAPLLESWALENAKLIASVEIKYLDEVGRLAHDMVRQGRSISDFRQELQKTYSLTKKQANVIARTEIAKLNGQITKARQESIGIQEYTWRTVGDERVRKRHEVLDGKVCRWDNPSVYRESNGTEWKSRAAIGGYIGHPGQDYMCRCTAAAHIEDLLERLGV